MKSKVISEILFYFSKLEHKQSMTAQLLVGQLDLLRATNAKLSDYVDLAEDARIATL